MHLFAWKYQLWHFPDVSCCGQSHVLTDIFLHLSGLYWCLSGHWYLKCGSCWAAASEASGGKQELDFLVTERYTLSTPNLRAGQFQFLENGIRYHQLPLQPAGKREVPLEGTKVLIFVPKSMISHENILMRM